MPKPMFTKPGMHIKVPDSTQRYIYFINLSHQSWYLRYIRIPCPVLDIGYVKGSRCNEYTSSSKRIGSVVFCAILAV